MDQDLIIPPSPSPKMIRDWKMFSLHDEDGESEILVSDVHDDSAYTKIRKVLSEQYSISNIIPDIQIVDVNLKGDRELKLKYTPYRKHVLKNDFRNVLEHLKTLWGYNVTLTM